MGCDIHAYIEYRSMRPHTFNPDLWHPFSKGINPGRDYFLFARLAGVRGNPAEAVVPPRGFPEDASYCAQNDAWIYITDDPRNEGNSTTPELAEQWHKRSGLPYKTRGDHKWIFHPDWHTHTWLTPDEWEKAISVDKPQSAPQYYATLAAMRAFEAAGYEARVVFWFDN